MLVRNFVDAAFGRSAFGNIGDDDVCVVVCAVVLLAVAVIVDAVVGNSRTGSNWRCFVNALIALCVLLHIFFISISLYEVLLFG